MKLDYEIEVDEEKLKLKLTILEQDERFWKKEFDNKEDSIKYECRNGFIIRSNSCVAIFGDKKIYLKGVNNKKNSDSTYFNTLQELNEYKQKLIEALEEFKAYEPDDINNTKNDLISLNDLKKVLYGQIDFENYNKVVEIASGLLEVKCLCVKNE